MHVSAISSDTLIINFKTINTHLKLQPLTYTKLKLKLPISKFYAKVFQKLISDKQ